MPLEKRFAVFKKRIHEHRAPAGWVTSFQVAIDEINFKSKTLDEAEKYIQDYKDEIEAGLNWFEIKEVWTKYIYPNAEENKEADPPRMV